MNVEWSRSAIGDLARLHAFLSQVNPLAAARVVARLKQVPRLLTNEPRLGTALPEFAPREVRRLIFDEYELRYEVTDAAVLMLRVWHTREDR